MKKKTILIALGGNALIQKKQKGTAEEQFNNLVAPMEAVVGLLKQGYNVIVSHGNGPQVGNILLQQASCDEVPPMPFAVVGAQTQGQIGFMIEATLRKALAEAGMNNRVITLLSQVVVDGNDPGFKNPTKPVGPFYTKEKAATLPYLMKETPHGFRRVVASPDPLEIMNAPDVKMLSEAGYVVVCNGGGGIPVKRVGNGVEGVDAVIDKDYANSLLASVIDCDAFVIATDEPKVCINYAKPDQRAVDTLTVEEARKLMAEGQFPAGSMGPKVEAVVRFAEKTGRPGIITSIDNIAAALEGDAGTKILK